MFPLQTNVYARTVPVVTWIVIGLNVLVFFFETQLSPEALTQLTYWFGVVPARYTDAEFAARFAFPESVDRVASPLAAYWPFLTSMFLHGGIMHIVGNMWTLAIFGRNVEDRLGHARYLLFYLLCGIISSVVHVIMNQSSTVPAIGASGAIAGVMGAYLVMFPMSRVIVMVPILIFPFFFDFLAVFYLGYWFLLQLMSGLFALTQASASHGGIAFWAHVGGFAAGIVMLGAFLPPRARRRVCHADEGCIEHAWSHI